MCLPFIADMIMRSDEPLLISDGIAISGTVKRCMSGLSKRLSVLSDILILWFSYKKHKSLMHVFTVLFLTSTLTGSILSPSAVEGGSLPTLSTCTIKFSTRFTLFISDFVRLENDSEPVGIY